MKSYSQNRIECIDSLFNRFDKLHHQFAVNVGLSDTAFRILRALLVYGEGCSQTTIYRDLCLNKQTVNSAIAKLASDRIIRFENGKGRENLLYLTSKGKKLVKAKIEPIEKIERSIIGNFTNTEYDSFIHVAEKYLSELTEKGEEL